MKTALRLLLLLAFGSSSLADGLADLCRDRTAVERVYYSHRLGARPPFEQVSPPSLIERLVKDDSHKEAVLKTIYGIDVTPAMLDAEVQRINTTTRAPEMLAELKAALGNDPNRFAQTVARPIVVERLLRDRFENDDALHARKRREVEQVRETLLTAKSQGESATNLLARLKQAPSRQVIETTWQLGARPAATTEPGPDLVAVQNRFGPQAQVLSSPPAAGQDQRLYFEDLPGELQNVLRAQLRRPGDVSAVIEMPGGFALYLAEDRTTNSLTAAALSIPKQSYERWLAEQTERKP